MNRPDSEVAPYSEPTKGKHRRRAEICEERSMSLRKGSDLQGVDAKEMSYAHHGYTRAY